MAEKIINAKGKKCPMPVLLTKKELKNMTTGQTIELIADDIGALKDIPALIKKTGDEIVETNQDGEIITFIIKKA
ncbi:MAG: sulfurtransferase TusA family protein [Candidatus Lokiarchaeota archaeon]|nr:sulfurtransferase TusA family protein [Candidatus Lokiarchaeota archaeon]